MTTKKELNALKEEIKALERKLDKFLKATKQSRAKTVKVTATDQVLNIINRSKNGVNASTIKKKTGFDDKKIRNILFRTFKQGKTQRADKGIYVIARKD